MIEDYFNRTITLCRPVRDKFERTTWYYTEYEVRLMEHYRTILVNGEYKNSSFKIFFPANADIKSDDRIYVGTGLTNPTSGSSGSGSGSTGGGSALPAQTYVIIKKDQNDGFEKDHFEVIA